MPDDVRWGVLGCARIATNRVIPALLQADGAALHAVASRSREKAVATARQFGAQQAYGSYDELLQDDAVEAVYIPLPNHMHKEWAIATLRAGKHVLCEKPIALNAAEARAMQAVAQETGLLLLEAFMYRFGEVTQRAIEIVRSGRIGHLQTIHSAFSFAIPDDPTNVRLQPETGGGALYDVGCYCINVQRMLAGREPSRAWATLNWSDEYGIDVAASGILDFGDQLYGTFSTGFTAPGGVYLRAVGTGGVMELPDGFLGRGEQARIVLNSGDASEAEIVTISDAYTLEIEDMSRAILGVEEAKFGWEPLDATMRVIDACYASDKSASSATV